MQINLKTITGEALISVTALYHQPLACGNRRHNTRDCFVALGVNN
jgi:hypothetical protein